MPYLLRFYLHILISDKTVHLDPEFSCRRFIDPGCSHRGVRDEIGSPRRIASFAFFDSSVGDRQVSLHQPGKIPPPSCGSPCEERQCIRRIRGNELVPSSPLYDLKALLFDLRIGRQNRCPSASLILLSEIEAHPHILSL